VKVLFVYKYLTLGGVEAVLRARLDGLSAAGIEAHAWFFHAAARSACTWGAPSAACASPASRDSTC
jgi:hypothetical protein